MTRLGAKGAAQDHSRKTGVGGGRPDQADGALRATLLEIRQKCCASSVDRTKTLANRQRYFNAKHTFQMLLESSIIPIVNENDTVAVEEMKFGDNDHLSALVATLLGADLLVILSDVQGVYDRDPSVYSECAIDFFDRTTSRERKETIER